MLPDSLLQAAARLRGPPVLVTGAAGFVGANLVRFLGQAGCTVHAVMRPGGHSWRMKGIGEDIFLHEADVADQSALDEVFTRVRPQYVFHLAVPRGKSEVAREEMLRVNVLGALALLRSIRKYPVSRLVVAGSSLEYAPSVTALKESDAVGPLTWHGATKAAAHVLFQQAAAADGLPVVLLRLFHVYGPWESTHRLGPTAIRAAWTGTPMALTESGIRRDWVFVEDVCEALLLAADKGGIGDVFNIGSGVETSNEDFVACVEAVTGGKVQRATERFTPRITDAKHRFADRTLVEERLGWRPRHDLHQGVRRTAEWLALNPWVWALTDDLPPETL